MYLTKSICFKMGICSLLLVTKKLGVHADLKSPDEPQAQNIIEPVGRLNLKSAQMAWLSGCVEL